MCIGCHYIFKTVQTQQNDEITYRVSIQQLIKDVLRNYQSTICIFDDDACMRDA